MTSISLILNLIALYSRRFVWEKSYQSEQKLNERLVDFCILNCLECRVWIRRNGNEIAPRPLY